MKFLLNALLGPRPEVRGEERRRLAYTAACALLFLFAAHAFGWFNLSYSGEAMMIDPTKGRTAQMGGGQFLLPLYWALRGNLSAPLLVGLLSCLYLCLCTALIVETLGVRSRCEIALIAGFLCSGASVTAINASQLHVADAYFLALLLAVAGAALCRRAKLGFLPASLLFAASAALEPSMVCAGATLLVLAGLFDALEGRPVGGRTGLLALAFGLALHVAGYALLMRRYGMDWEAAIAPPLGMGDGALPGALMRAYGYPIVRAVRQQTAHPALCTALAAALFALGLAALGAALARLPAKARFKAAVLTLLLPVAVNLPVFTAQRAGETREMFAFVFLPIGAMLLCRRATACRAAAKRAVAAACAALFASAVIFSNQVYLKKTLELQATLSAMTRVIDRMEHTDGYEVGVTPVAMLGSLEDSVLAVSKQGFEHLEAFDAARNRYAPVTIEDYTWYLWEVLGYPCSLVSYYQSGQLALREDVQAMPAFPAQGCCQMIDGIMVVRLSEKMD
ncbi:MAG: hypothetical protein Q4G52_07880 [Clostridia bacterium]|nr:hypothetical protein [Clostridia bacterium]